MSESFVLVETRGRVGLLTLNRPKALNAPVSYTHLTLPTKA